MIMEPEVYKQYRETRLHEQPGFAYDTYLCSIPKDFSRVNLHWHDQMEIIYIKRGSGNVSINLQPMQVAAGDIVPIMPGELHSIEVSGGETMEYENMIFSLSILDSTESDDWCRRHVIYPLKQGMLHFERPIRPGSAFYRSVSAALDGADLACMKRESGYSLVVKSELFLFLHALYVYRIPDREPASSPEAVKLKELISYVKEHFSEVITIKDAAQLTGYSSSHFMRIFRRETGQTFVDFLNDYRLSASLYYLKETKESIAGVAALCGFDNISYFIRIFHKKYGISPGKYRKSGSV